jgi:predicted ATPase
MASPPRPVPYLERVYIRPDAVFDRTTFPFSLPFVERLDLAFQTLTTFFVGENGSGKSTLIEGVAALCRLPVSGGGRNERADSHGPELSSELARHLRPSFRRQPRNGYFFRAEFQAHFASLLDQRKADPDFKGDPYARYGGRSLHTRSHGEAFLHILTSWMGPGIILMDEPEAALSPQRQLTLLAAMARLASRGDVQFVIATHSPILLTFPGASIISFDDPELPAVRLEDTAHFQITKGILDSPGRYWKHLLDDEVPGRPRSDEDD